jgi:hypothetical protein
MSSRSAAHRRAKRIPQPPQAIDTVGNAAAEPWEIKIEHTFEFLRPEREYRPDGWIVLAGKAAWCGPTIPSEIRRLK